MSLLTIQSSAQDRSFPSVRRPLDNAAIDRGTAGTPSPDSADLAPGVAIQEPASTGEVSLNHPSGTGTQESVVAAQTYSVRGAPPSQGGGESAPQSLWPSIWPPIWGPIWRPSKGGLPVKPPVSAAAPTEATPTRSTPSANKANTASETQQNSGNGKQPAGDSKAASAKEGVSLLLMQSRIAKMLPTG